MGWLRVRLGGALVVGVLAIGACSSDPSEAEDFGLLPPAEADELDAPSSSTTTTARPTTTSTTATTAEPTGSTLPNGKPILEIPTEWDSDLDEIFGRYLLYWQALAIAMGPPEPSVEYPPLVELTEPDVLADLELQFVEIRQAGHVLIEEGTVTEHNPRLPNPSLLSKTEGNAVTIQDCFIDARILQTLDGAVLDDSIVAKLKNVKMEVIGGEWRVSGVRDALPDSDGHEECAEYGEQFKQA